MRITETFIVASPRQQVAELFADIERVHLCVPGVTDLVASGDGTYAATIAVQVGPIKTRFAGEITLDRAGLPGRITGSAKGTDRGTGSRADVTLSAVLAEEGAGTSVTAEADVVIRGKLAQYGAGVITGTASKLIEEFATSVQATLAGAEHVAPATAKVPLRQLMRAALARLFSRRRRQTSGDAV